jgi:hypothetical protein
MLTALRVSLVASLEGRKVGGAWLLGGREVSSVAMTAVTYQTRLETRTKESSMYASHQVLNLEA